MREVININGKWAFSKEAAEIPQEMPQNWYWVNLPHTWNAIDGQDGFNDYYRGTCYYAKTIRTGELPKAEQYYLEINGANSSADVYMNGEKAGHHDGGYSTWRIDITEKLTEETLIVIAVDNSPNDSVYPQVADFTFYGGLYRDVNLIAVGSSHFSLDYYGGPGLEVTPEPDDTGWSIKVKTYVTRKDADSWVRVSILDAEGREAASGEAGEDGMVSLLLPDAHIWNGKKDPYLYIAKAELFCHGELQDCVSARFGCRTYEIDPEKGFLLNGKPYPLHGVSRHQDRLGIGNALLPQHHDEDVDLILELGANTIRLAHYQHAQYFYDLCDENGLVVWAEIPYISQHMKGGRENTISQMRELIAQNYNHPSICVWGLSNEITMKGEKDPDLIENHRILNELVKELDPYRKTTMAVISMCPTDAEYLKIPDCISYNHYFGWYGGDTSMNGPWFDRFHAEHPEIPVGVSEYGCEALDWHTSEPRQGDYTEEYQACYHEELIRQLFTRPYIWATHVWNMFDFAADARNEGGENGQNHKGLVTFDRKYKKDAFYAYKAWLSEDPFVHICGKRYVDRVEDVTKVTVYSNQPEVELFANGVSFGVQKCPDHFFYFEVPNAEETTLAAVAGTCRDESRIRKVEVFNEAYRLKEQGAVLNWFDITQKDGYYCLNDSMGDIMASEQGRELLGGILEKMSGQTEAETGGYDMSSGAMRQLLNGFSVIRLLNLMGVAGMSMTKEQMLKLNHQLNQIKKQTH